MEPREALEKHGFRFHHKLGQNFIFDDALLQRIVIAADVEGKDVLEIGPGAASLTRCLCQKANKVVSVEIDQNLVPVIMDVMGDYDNFVLVRDDIMKVHLPALVQTHFSGAFHVVANLPYYITTPIIMMLLEGDTKPATITAMVQKEVAERLMAAPGGKDYGAITASVAYWADISLPMHVPANSFFPRPKVDSALIHCKLWDESPVQVLSKPLLFRVIRASFAMRRKTLLNNLCASFGLTRDEAGRALEEAGLEANIRGERLALKDFARLSDCIYRIQQENC